MNTHETYVSLEVAKLLKQAGFDWKVRYMYRNNNPTLCICSETPYRNMPKPNKCPMFWQYAAPTLSVAQKWLREVKHIDVFVWISCLQNYKWIGKNIGLELDFTVHTGENLYTTYEEAQEAGIKKCLEIILEKGE